MVKNEQYFVNLGRLHYLRGFYEKPSHSNIPECYNTYRDPYSTMIKDYDMGWHLERSVLPDLYKNSALVPMLVPHNFGDEEFRRDWKAGYRAFHAGIPLDKVAYKDYNKMQEGYFDAKSFWEEHKNV